MSDRSLSDDDQRRSQITEDYSQYLSNLFGIQEFVRNIKGVLSACNIEDGETELAQDLINFYLAPLRVYEGDIRHIRNRVQHAANDIPEVLMELLDSIEPDIQLVTNALQNFQISIAELSASFEEQKPEVPTDSDQRGLSNRTEREPIAVVSIEQPTRTTVTRPNAHPGPPNVVPLQPVRPTEQPTRTTETSPSAHSSPPNVVPLQPVRPTERPGVTEETIKDSEQPGPSRRVEHEPTPVVSIATAEIGRTIEEWINDLKKTKPEGKTIWRLERHSEIFLQHVCDRYEKSKSRELLRDLEIIFDGEKGVDRGALTREFFYIAFEQTMQEKFKDAKLMVGERGHVLPDATADYLVHAFEFIGKMIAHAVRQGCKGFPGLSPAVQAYIVHGDGPAFIEEFAPPVSVDDVAEHNLHEALSKLEKGENLTEDNRKVLETWMERCDCRVMLKENTRHLILQQLLIYYVFKRRISQIEALARGMETFDLRKFLRENPTEENIRIVFPSPSDMDITSQLFKGLMITRGDGFDDTTWEYFEKFLDDLEAGAIENATLADLVIFLSGSPHLPSRIVISFSSKDVMPVAHTCYNELQLPTVHRNYEAFCENMVQGMAHRTFTLE